MHREFQPVSLVQLVIFQVLLFLPLCLRPFHGRALVFFPLLCTVYYRLATSSLGSAPLDWSLTLAITAQLLKALDVWVLTNAESDLRRTHSVSEDPVNFTIWNKVCWAVELISTPRGVGWNWEVPYVCYTGTTSRSAFIRSRLPRVLFYYLLLDLVDHTSPKLSHGPLPLTRLFSVAVLVPTWSYAIGAYLQLWMLHTIPALMIVCTKLGEARSFPYVMGPIGFMNSLRCFWGRTWHQSSRRQLSSLGRWVRDRIFHAAPGSHVSAYTQLCTGFALGGITHAIAGSVATEETAWRDRTGALSFFALQLLGVILEDVLFATLRMARVTQKDWRRGHMKNGKGNYGVSNGQWRLHSCQQAIGYVVVVGWLSMTLPAYVEGLRKEGILETKAVPFSIVDWIIRMNLTQKAVQED